MERRIEINFSLVLIISAMMHLFLIIAVVAPQYSPSAMRSALKERMNAGGGMRDVIVNINADERLVENETTLLSDKDSSAKGHITRDYGDTWLNNSQEFSLPGAAAKGQSGSANGRGGTKGSGSGAGSGSGTAQASKQASSAGDSEDYPVSLTLLHDPALSGSGIAASMAESEWTKIPDKKGITMKNALFLTNEGAFSYNTKKFADFEYFRKMKNKIGSNWFPPNSVSGIMPEQANSMTGYGTPGYTAFRMVPSQEVKLYFTMDRDGTVRDIVIVDSQGNESLDKSCVNSIRSSGNFGKVPSGMTGELVVIPFIFGYYVY
jgi:TonB family protein